MKRLPPHIAWPLFIIAILATGISTVIVTVVAAHTDDGPQVIDDYYQKAVEWDAQMAEKAASDALGWKASFEILEPDTNPALRPTELTLLDREGRPLMALQGTIQARRPHLAGTVATIPLSPAPDRPGVYRQHLPIQQAGLWDFEIVAEQGSQRFQKTIRIDVR